MDVRCESHDCRCQKGPKPFQANSSIQGRKRYLEAEDTADEEENEEDQADVAENRDLVLVREVIRLQRKKDGGGWKLPPNPAMAERAFSYQLLQVILNGVGVNHDADGHQGVESKVKYLVAEKWDNPGGTQLKETCTAGFHDHRAGFQADELMTRSFTLYAP